MTDFQTHIFNNRLPALYLHDPNTRIYSAVLLVGVGTRFETKKTEGISRFYTNTCLQGSSQYPDQNSLAAAIDKLGLTLQTKVSPEYTTTSFTSPDKHFFSGLKLVLNMFFRPKLTDANLEKERKLALEEVKYSIVNPQYKALNNLNKQIFNNSPLGFNLLGTEESIQNLKLNKLQEFKNKYYTAQNCLLTITGPTQEFRFSKLKETIEKIDPGDRQEFTPFDFSKTQIVREKENIMGKKSYLTFGTLCYGRSSKKRVVQSLLINILITGRTNQRLTKMQKTNLIQSIKPWIKVYSDCGLFLVRTQCASKKERQVKEAIVQELTSFNQGKPITENELDQAKAYYKNQLLTKLQDKQQLSLLLALSTYFNLTEKTVDEIIERVETTTVEEINEIAQSIFTSDSLSWYILGSGF
jgi:predicted Zn-dependent peptidase